MHEEEEQTGMKLDTEDRVGKDEKIGALSGGQK